MKEENKQDAKKKLNTLDKYIIFCLSVLVLYTIAHTIIFAITGLEAKILDTLTFGAFSGEMLFCFLIKKFKLHEEAKLIFDKKKKDETNNDDEYYGG